MTAQTPITQSTCGEILAPSSVNGGHRVADEVGQGADALAPDVQRGLADQDGDADGDDDHPQHRGALEPADEDHLDQRADGHGDEHRRSDGQRQRHELAAGRWQIMPPSIRNSPWAKLMMPVVL